MKSKIEKFYNEQASIYLHADKLTVDEWIQAGRFIKKYSVIVRDTFSQTHLNKISLLLLKQAGYKDINDTIKNKYLNEISRLFALYVYVAYKYHGKKLIYKNHINNNLNEIMDLIECF